MNSLKSLKMKKVRGFLDSKETIQKTRVALERKTEKDFRDYAHSKQNIREHAHQKHLD